MRVGRIEILRAVTTSLFILFFAAAPILGIMYGTSCALTFGGFSLISPLELILLITGTKTVLLTWLIPGLAAILIVVFFGRFFCGWICPVGILFGYSHVITQGRKPRLAGGLWKNRERYAVLFAVLSASLLFGFAAPYLFSPPGVVYRAIISFTLSRVIGTELMVLLLFFILDLLALQYGRTWCNTLCPLGTVISSLGLVNLFRPEVDREACVGSDSRCLNCWRVCPMRIPVTKADRWAMMACSKCLKCWANCPANAIRIEVIDRSLLRRAEGSIL